MVFTIGTDGTGYTALHNFNGHDGASADGGGMAFSGGTLYGATLFGGNSNCGTIFRMSADGTGFTNLYHFTGCSGPLLTNRDGAYPNCELTLSGDTVYGSARYGGSAGQGTVFKLSTDGTGFTVLHDFSSDDGANPSPGFVLSNNALYGTASSGGSGSNGTIFKINTDGTGFAVLHSFHDRSSHDGMFPAGNLILSGDTLYGTTTWGGGLGDDPLNGKGLVFKVSTNGMGYCVLHDFTGGGDGGHPTALAVTGTTLYGTAALGGVIFQMNTDGTGFSILYSHPPTASYNYWGHKLILADNVLYGMISLWATDSGGGGVYRFILPPAPPRLSVTPWGQSVILTWPTNSGSFALQICTDLTSANWSTVTSAPGVIAQQNTVTNSCAGAAQKFFRLIGQ